MTQRNMFGSTQPRSLFTDIRTSIATGFTVAALLAASLGARAQATDAATDSAAQATPATDSAATAPAKPTFSVSDQKPAKTRKQDRVIESKDTKKEDKKAKKDNALAGMDVKLPDKQLYDKAEDAVKHGRFDVARLDLQTLLNTYPESQFMMRSKLAIADSWYKEGGTAALTQAEQEYKDFITFFPNAPEAAEAQMRVGDIYFRQMDKPDRDYTKTTHAEEEYRLMLQQFPDSPLVPQARQRLREVQETMAAREADIASFYATRTPANLPAAIARYQTVVDTYPLYSHMDDVLVGLGDLYEEEAKYIRSFPRLPEAARARLEKIYDDQAADAYRKVILEHSAAAHVEDARDRLVGMGLPVPTPTAEQMAASAALENSRGQYTLKNRATLLFIRQADTVPAATIGAPPLEDATPTLAPTIVHQSVTNFQTSLNPELNTPRPAAANAPANTPAATDGSAPAVAAAPLSFQDVPTDTTGAAASGSSATVREAPAVSPASISSGSSMGVEIIQPSGSTAPVTAPATPPAFPGTAAPAKPSDNGGIGPVGPPNSAPLAPIEKAADAPALVNDADTKKTPATQTLPPANGKKPKVDCDKDDESCSTKKKKKGLGKLNPF